MAVVDDRTAYDAVFESNFAQNVNPDDPSTLDSNNFKARQIDVIGNPVPALPDLIVTDLTMPGIDGFGLVEELKMDPRTRDIPVVVVSAKDITQEERERLNGHIQAVFQKGSLAPRKFVDKVRRF